MLSRTTSRSAMPSTVIPYSVSRPKTRFMCLENGAGVVEFPVPSGRKPHIGAECASSDGVAQGAEIGDRDAHFIPRLEGKLIWRYEASAREQIAPVRKFIFA